jgi:hypothetical protein
LVKPAAIEAIDEILASLPEAPGSSEELDFA